VSPSPTTTQVALVQTLSCPRLIATKHAKAERGRDEEANGPTRLAGTSMGERCGTCRFAMVSHHQQASAHTETCRLGHIRTTCISSRCASQYHFPFCWFGIPAPWRGGTEKVNARPHVLQETVHTRKWPDAGLTRTYQPQAEPVKGSRGWRRSRKRSSSFRAAWKVWFPRSSTPHRLCKGWINLSSL
jgi:hypothetical protein